MNWPDPQDAAGPLGDGRLATAIDRPTSIDELKGTVLRRAGEGLAVYPQGGRTSIDYGDIPRRPGVAVDLKGLNRVVDYPAADMTITVEAGITLDEIARILDTEGQRLEIDAPQPDRATIGGVYATNSTGPRRYGSGRPRDQIIGVGFVTADGNLVHGGGRVVKNVAGYDFPKLLTGSLGTLGLIAQVTLKVRPRPEATAVTFVRYGSFDCVAHDLERLNTSSTRPVAIELLGPDGSGKTWTVALGFEDNEASVAWQVDRIGAELSGSVEAIYRDGESNPHWSLLREFPARESGSISIVLNVKRSAVASIVAAMDPGVWSIQAHAGNGLVRAHSRIGDLDRLDVDIHRFRSLAEESGGNLVVPRCPTHRKESLKVWGNPRPDWGWCERVKDTFDPAGMMNPGRFVGRI